MYRDHSGELIPIIVARRRVDVRPAGLARVALAHLVPHLLGVDDHAVQVEDDRVDQSAW